MNLSPSKITRFSARQTEKELRELQRRTFATICLPLGPGGRSQPTWHDGRPLGAVVAEFIAPNDRLTPLERIAIYNRQYWYRLLDCLWDDYPGLRAVMGKRRFEKLRVAYLQRYPSRSFTLRSLGSNLVGFLTEEPALTAPHQKLCLDMARFEWAQIVAFDGPARPPIHIDDLLGKEPSHVRLGLQPYITLLEMDYPLDEYVLALKKRDAAFRAESSNAVEASSDEPRHARPPRPPRPHKVYLAVHRHDNDLYYKRLSHDQYAVLRAIGDGFQLAQACEVLWSSERDEAELAADVRGWFEQWVAMRWLCQRVTQPAIRASKPQAKRVSQWRLPRNNRVAFAPRLPMHGD
jgi:hypothetical protein